MDNAAFLLDGDSGMASLPPHRTFGFRVWMLRHAWTRRVEAALAPTALTHMQFFILSAVGHMTKSGAALSQTRIADGLHADSMTVSKVVRTLEAKGLLARAVHPADPRAKCVALTAAGAELARHGAHLVLAEQERFFGRLGPDGKAAFSNMLDTLLEHDDAGATRPHKEMA